MHLNPKVVELYTRLLDYFACEISYSAKKSLNYNCNLKTCQLIVSSYLLCYFKVVPYVVLTLLIHPSTSHRIANRFTWVFCVYLEAVLVLPHLHLLQNTKFKK
jgi:hypothetical protein